MEQLETSKQTRHPKDYTLGCRQKEEGYEPVNRLGVEDSNLGIQIQSLLSYH